MLEDYFVKPETVDRIRASWISELIERYVEWMAARGYAARTVLHRVPLLVGFGAFAAERGATHWDELPAHVEAYVRARLQSRSGFQDTHARRGAAIRSVIEQLLRLVLPAHADHQHLRVGWPFAGQTPGFPAYLRDERGGKGGGIFGHVSGRDPLGRAVQYPATDMPWDWLTGPEARDVRSGALRSRPAGGVR
jgi:hypothetical protein